MLLTYGGWNEAAYISSEMRGRRRNLARALLWGIAIITGIYLLANVAYLRGLGLDGMARSEAVAADLMRRWLGERGAVVVSVLVAISAMTSANATVLTGARANYALGRDFRFFGFLGRWRSRAGTPGNALLVQGVIALTLVSLGALTRSGFATMVEYTAPVFWAFFLLTGAALIVLRIREPHAPEAVRRAALPRRRPCSFALRAPTCSIPASRTRASERSSGLPYCSPACPSCGGRAGGKKNLWRWRTRRWNGTWNAIEGFERSACCSWWPSRPAWRWAWRSPGAESAQQTARPLDIQPEVPYVPTREDVLAEMMKMAAVTKNDFVFDLGCGDGRIVITAVKDFGARGVGIDIDPRRIDESEENARKAGVQDRVEFIQGDLFEANLSKATVVTLYLLPSVNLRLRPKLLKELKPGTRVVSHNYDMGDWKPLKQTQVGRPHGLPLGHPGENLPSSRPREPRRRPGCSERYRRVEPETGRTETMRLRSP